MMMDVSKLNPRKDWIIESSSKRRLLPILSREIAIYAHTTTSIITFVAPVYLDFLSKHPFIV